MNEPEIKTRGETLRVEREECRAARRIHSRTVAAPVPSGGRGAAKCASYRIPFQHAAVRSRGDRPNTT